MMSLKTSLKYVPLIAIGAFPDLSVAGEYAIDPVHSNVVFKVRHLGISTVSGRFESFSGTLVLDPGNINSIAARAVINANSINTDVEQRDEHLRSADFFDVENYPEITFTSTRVEGVKDNAFNLHGELTLHGVTRPIVLSAEFGGVVRDPWGQERVAITASATINRKDFGLGWNQVLETGGLLVGEEVQIALAVEGVLQTESASK